MAEGDRENPNAFRGMERVGALKEVIEDFRIRRERGQGSASPPTMIH